MIISSEQQDVVLNPEDFTFITRTQSELDEMDMETYALFLAYGE